VRKDGRNLSAVSAPVYIDAPSIPDDYIAVLNLVGWLFSRPFQGFAVDPSEVSASLYWGAFRPSCFALPFGVGRGYAAFWRKGSAGEFHGSSSASFVCGVSAIRARTSASQACGSTLLSFAVWMSVYIKRLYDACHALVAYPVAGGPSSGDGSQRLFLRPR
jgi:hypothetical protein